MIRTLAGLARLGLVVRSGWARVHYGRAVDPITALLAAGARRGRAAQRCGHAGRVHPRARGGRSRAARSRRRRPARPRHDRSATTTPRSPSSRCRSRSCSRSRSHELGREAVLRAGRRGAQRRAVQRDQPRGGHRPPGEPDGQRGRDRDDGARSRATTSTSAPAAIVELSVGRSPGRSLVDRRGRLRVGVRDRRPQPRARPPAALVRRSSTGRSTTRVETYFRQCSVLVTVRDLAVMAATLAFGGVNPVTRRAGRRASGSRAM